MGRQCVGAESEFPVGELRRVNVGAVPVCIARVDSGRMYAIGDLCTHEETPLSEGELVGNEVECPLHLSRFDLLTGEPSNPPAMRAATTYAVVLEDDLVYVDSSPQNSSREEVT